MAEVCNYDKKSLKDSHKLCIIYIIFSPDPDKVGYENHKPYLRTPYLNPYQMFAALLGRNEKIENYNYWCHVKTLCIINIRYKYEISKLHIFEENNILVFLGV